MFFDFQVINMIKNIILSPDNKFFFDHDELSIHF